MQKPESEHPAQHVVNGPGLLHAGFQKMPVKSMGIGIDLVDQRRDGRSIGQGNDFVQICTVPSSVLFEESTTRTSRPAWMA